MKKSTITTSKKLKQSLIFATVAGMSVASYADTTSPMGNLGNQFSSLANQKSLQAEIQQLAIGAVDLFSQSNFQKDPNLEQIQQANTALVSPIAPGGTQAPGTVPLPISPSQWVADYTKQATEGMIRNTLTSFAWAFYNNDGGKPDFSKDGGNLTAFTTPGQKPEPYNTFLQSSTTDGLVNLQTSDSLKLALANSPYGNVMDMLTGAPTTPTTNDNGALNFSNLITPTAYKTGTNQAQTANQFIKFATLYTISPGFQLNLGKIMSKKVKTTQQNVKALLNDPDYKSLLLASRNLTAIRSIALNIFNHYIAERTPVHNLAKNAGLADALGSDNASPLQIEQYQATHDLQDPNWYKSVQNATPATLLRKIVIELAQIKAQNFRNYQARERQTSAVLANTLALNIVQQKNLQMLVTSVNKTLGKMQGSGS